MFQVIAAGRPYALHNCSATEMSAPLDVEELGTKSGTGLVVRCLEGYDGGLPIYSYLLEVVADEDGGPILLNKSVPASPNGPTFEVAGLTTGRSYRLFLYAINAKGRSEPAILEPVTLKGVAMYTTGECRFSSFEDIFRVSKIYLSIYFCLAKQNSVYHLYSLSVTKYILISQLNIIIARNVERQQ